MSPAEFCDLTDPCYAGREWALANCQDMDHAWATARPDWLVWIATRPGVLDDRTLRLFAVWSARQVQHLMTDPRSLAVLDVAERHAEGYATDEELAAARDAARDVARDAAWAAAWAARAAARDAARDAARAAAWASARDAALAAQAAWLRANATPDWARVRREMGGCAMSQTEMQARLAALERELERSREDRARAAMDARNPLLARIAELEAENKDLRDRFSNADTERAQLAQTEKEKDRDKIKSENSRKYWRGKNNALQARIGALENCIEAAWGIIANVSRGNWSEQHPEWQEAAIKWRDRYVVTRHATVAEGGAR